MEVIWKTPDNNIATVFVARADNGGLIEFVESSQPPFSWQDKWIFIVSTLFGCPSGCLFCDAGGDYKGRLSFEEIMFQIDYLIARRFPNRDINVKRLKIQFARMGEPSLNPDVLRVIEELPRRYRLNTLIPSISTIAPHGSERFFERLLNLKNELYSDNFQLQFSIHSTDAQYRDYLMPMKKWDLDQIADYGNRFISVGNRRITLNFALTEKSIIDPETLLSHFNPDKFLIKITPVNPTFQATANNIVSKIDPQIKQYEIIDNLRKVGFEVILSIGEVDENSIGSNCGQFINAIMRGGESIPEAYQYPLESCDNPYLGSI